MYSLKLPLVKYILKRDEKWITYGSVQPKMQWIDKDKHPQSALKVELHRRKLVVHVVNKFFFLYNFLFSKNSSSKTR